MCAGSAWHDAQVVATLVGNTGDCASVTRRTPCAPWQLMHVATLVSPFASCLPCVLVAYSAAWSTRSFGANRRISSASLWQLAHVAMIASPAGLPLKPLLTSWALALSALAGSPPWQFTQANPLSRCTSGPLKSVAGAASRSSGSAAWHVRHALGAAAAAGVCAGAAPGRSSSAAIAARKTTVDLRDGMHMAAPTSRSGR